MKKSNKAVTPGETHAIAEVQRSILPIPDAQHVGLTTFGAKDPDTAFPPIESLRPPMGAPNVLIVLLDDVGFAAMTAAASPRAATSGSMSTASRWARAASSSRCR